jgi:hypothetical protein
VYGMTNGTERPFAGVARLLAGSQSNVACYAKGCVRNKFPLPARSDSTWLLRIHSLGGGECQLDSESEQEPSV